jgi:uncharacterized protein involved in type VI secretion and phage assembly
MPLSAQVATWTIKIGGSDVSADFMNDVVEVEVDQSLLLPAMFTIRLNDADLQWIDDAGLLDVGKEVEIEVESEKLFSGEITAIEPRFAPAGGTTLVIRGYDKSHRLHRGRLSRTFLNQKDSDIVSTLAGEAGLSPNVDKTTGTREYVLQYNQTNWEFLMELAERNGYWVCVQDVNLCFNKEPAQAGDPPELKWAGEAGATNLREFNARVSAAHQVAKTECRAWDTRGKEPITSEEDAATWCEIGISESGGDKAQDAFGAAGWAVVDRPAFSTDEAGVFAKAAQAEIDQRFVTAECVCGGNACVRAGGKVKIVGVGHRFEGTYRVTRALHRRDLDSGYKTEFSVSGRDVTLADLIAPAGQNGSKAQGAWLGLVTNLKDDEELGRVKVKFPWLGDEIESWWVPVVSIGAGPERGLQWMPEVDDTVVVMFEHGDIHRPLLVGGVWNNKDKPVYPNSECAGDGKVNKRVLKSRSGHIIELDDTDGEEKIIIRDMTEKQELVIDSKKNTFAITADGDVTIDSKNGKVTVNSKSDLTIEAKGNLTIKSTGNLKLDSGGNLDVKAAANATVKGVQTTVEGSGKAEVKGATVSVNGSGMAEIKGGLVKIN